MYIKNAQLTIDFDQASLLRYDISLALCNIDSSSARMQCQSQICLHKPHSAIDRRPINMLHNDHQKFRLDIVFNMYFEWVFKICNAEFLGLSDLSISL